MSPLFIGDKIIGVDTWSTLISNLIYINKKILYGIDTGIKEREKNIEFKEAIIKIIILFNLGPCDVVRW